MSPAIDNSRAFYQVAFAMKLGDVVELPADRAPPPGTMRTTAAKLGIKLRYIPVPLAQKLVVIRMA